LNYNAAAGSGELQALSAAFIEQNSFAPVILHIFKILINFWEFYCILKKFSRNLNRYNRKGALPGPEYSGNAKFETNETFDNTLFMPRKMLQLLG